jgi:hypothetical protein
MIIASCMIAVWRRTLPDAQNKTFWDFLIAIFFAVASCILLSVGTALLLPGSELEAIWVIYPARRSLLMPLPYMARSRFFDAGHWYACRKHWLLSPPEMGLVVGSRHFSCQWDWRCWTDFLGWQSQVQSSFICYSPTCARYLPSAQGAPLLLSMLALLSAPAPALITHAKGGVMLVSIHGRHLICPRRRSSGVIVNPCANTEKATTAKVIVTMAS